MKTIGIVADNYKVNKFKKELTKKGFTNFETFPFTSEATNIKVKVGDDDVGRIRTICEYVEAFFKRRN